MRVVYSFSIPDNSIAHWQLKKWKAEGVVISRHLQKLIEGEGSAILELEAHNLAQEKKIKRQYRIMNSLVINNPGIRLPDGWEEVDFKNHMEDE